MLRSCSEGLSSFSKKVDGGRRPQSGTKGPLRLGVRHSLVLHVHPAGVLAILRQLGSQGSGRKLIRFSQRVLRRGRHLCSRASISGVCLNLLVGGT